jgi:hypothetical protein
LIWKPIQRELNTCNITLLEGRKKHSLKIANISFEDVEKFKYLGTALSDQIYTTSKNTSNKIG